MYENTQSNLKRFSRNDRLAILAQVCVDNNINPQKGNYKGLIRKVCLTKLNTSEGNMNELTRALTTAYYTDQWQSLLCPPDEVIGESGLTPNTFEANITPQIPIVTEPTQPPPAPYNYRADVQKEMQKLGENINPEPVKKIEPQQTTQQDRLTEKQLCQIFYNIAKRDTFDGVGRIILHEARTIADDKHLTIDMLQQLWNRCYPLYEATTRSNILLIYWEGKDNLNFQRKATAIIQPKAPIFKPKQQEQGDIYEEDEGVVPEQNNGEQ